MLDGLFVIAVDASLADSDDLVFFQEGFKEGNRTKPPRVDAEAIPWLLMRVNINKRHFRMIHLAKITNFADKYMVMQRYRSWILPIAILLGVFFHEYIVVLAPALPYLIGLMLFFSFNSLDVRKMKFSMFDFTSS